MTLQCDLPNLAHTAPHTSFPDPLVDVVDTTALQIAVFGGGCYWCIEAVYRELEGVISVTAGYAGGDAASANYAAVASGQTEHAEVAKISYDSAQITYGRLLKVFFTAAHDPTQLDRQGNDRGRHYRSVIFYAGEEQKQVAQAYIDLLNSSGAFRSPIVTQLQPLTDFFEGEADFQNYAQRNPEDDYIRSVTAPKVEKVRTYFVDILKDASN
jgi:peptide-methionine (S)-S-oxide reductase